MLMKSKTLSVMSHLKSYDVSFLLSDHVYISVFTERGHFLKGGCKENTIHLHVYSGVWEIKWHWYFAILFPYFFWWMALSYTILLVKYIIYISRFYQISMTYWSHNFIYFFLDSCLFLQPFEYPSWVLVLKQLWHDKDPSLP